MDFIDSNFNRFIVCFSHLSFLIIYCPENYFYGLFHLNHYPININFIFYLIKRLNDLFGVMKNFINNYYHLIHLIINLY